jgi:hypothetical protein
MFETSVEAFKLTRQTLRVPLPIGLISAMPW